MICLSLGNMSFDALMEHLKYAPMAELRMDLLNLAPSHYEAIFAHHRNLIATCRAADAASAYMMANDMGAAYIDVDIAHPAADALVAHARRRGCGVVLSCHNFETTPPLRTLHATLLLMQQRGASVAKLACMARSPSHCHDMLALYDAPALPLVAFCMGALGRPTRALSLLLGAPFAYACAPGQPTALGQPTFDELMRLWRGCITKEAAP